MIPHSPRRVWELLRTRNTNSYGKRQQNKNTEAKHILSRGEQKLLSIIWTYSQHKTIKDMFNKEPVLILDDIKSELDSYTFEVFLSLLELIETQVIFSCIEDIISSKIEDKFKGLKKFHVEQFKT